MGCTHWTRQQEPEVEISKPNEKGFKSLFYATTEFDLSRSDSEDDEDIYSLNSMKHNKQQIINQSFLNSNTSNSINNSSPTTVNSMLNNQIVQTTV